jgi:uncharacterized protein YjbI with pentapeptide repeats
VKDTRLNGTTVNHCTLQNAALADSRFDGCTLGSTTFVDAYISGCTFRGVSMRDSAITGSRIKDSRLEAAAFSALKIEKSDLKNVVIRDGADGRFPRNVENLSLVDVKLDNVQFIGCALRDTTIRGIKAEGLRIRGKDLSGRTIETVEDLRALSER